MNDSGSSAPDDRLPSQRPVPETCSVCPHPWAAHDALGARFCLATIAAVRTRGCICRP
ncbi:RGCVC family protein [Actinomycetospora succinea]|uniref:RGCVC family protein n=1 Tax=Actinomycetospora succinea TaxID=663603 RepID=UPI001AAC9F53